jgi:hypothetical protein
MSVCEYGMKKKPVVDSSQFLSGVTDIKCIVTALNYDQNTITGLLHSKCSIKKRPKS